MKDTPKPGKRRKYDAAFRAEALRLAEQSRSTQAAARALNIDPKRIYQWQKATQTPVAAALGGSPGPGHGRRAAPAAGPGPAAGAGAGNFKKSHRQHLLEAQALADAGPLSRCRFIAAERGHHPVRQLCQVLDVPASGYYAWQAGQQPLVGSSAPPWETVLVKASRYHKRRYGTRQLQGVLRQNGHRVGRQRLRAAVQRRGLHALQPKAYTPRTTDSTHGLRCAPNRLPDQPQPTQANRVWVSDVTYLPLANGCWVVPRAYLCAFQGMCTKHVVGWHVGASMPEQLVTIALQRALLAQDPVPGLLVHSDRGGQYCGNAYRALLHQHGAIRSQSRRGDCYDNAQAENRFKVLDASGPGSKRRCSNGANGLFLPTWPTPRPASPTILTTTITSACTPVSAIRPLITLTNNLFKLLP